MPSNTDNYLKAVPIVLNGESVALALTGTVYRGAFYGRTINYRGWTNVILPMHTLLAALNLTEASDLCPTTSPTPTHTPSQHS